MIKLTALLNEIIIFEMKEDLRNVKFVRYGGLSPVIQHGYGDSDMHSPPAKKGIYAFPYPFIEPFLLGGDYADPKAKDTKNPTNRIKYVRDKEGNVIDNNHQDFDKLTDKSDKYWSFYRGQDKDGNYKHVLYQNAHRKIFSYKGELWHHLDCKPYEILKTHNDWKLSTYSNYTKILAKEIHKLRFNRENDPSEYWSANGEKKKDFGGNTIIKAPIGNLWKDHLEVFIERVK